MKRFILILSIFFSSAGIIHAQEQRGIDPVKKEQKIKALYVAYISQELKLTEEEAQRFWPVHTQFDSETRGLQTESGELEKQQLILNVKKKYQDRFVKILGTERTNDFFRKDAEFRKKLVERLHNMRQFNNGKQRPELKRN
ncbi:MAG: hypothetical protein ABIP80_04540 [Ferruginibacter sp.]